MKKIAIYGAGGFGREVVQLIHQINRRSTQWEIQGYFDDHIARGERVGDFDILGGIDDLNKIDYELNLVIGIAYNDVRAKIVSDVDNAKIIYPILIHPSVIMDDDEVRVAEGCIITAGNILTTNINIGRHSIINLGCTIGHDVIIKDYCAVMPGVHLSGNIKVGEGVLIGTGARILQNLAIGNHAKVGAGAVVTEEVQTGQTVVGIPAKRLMK